MRNRCEVTHLIEFPLSLRPPSAMLSKNNRSYRSRHFKNRRGFHAECKKIALCCRARSRSATSAKERPLIRLQIISEKNFTAVTSYALIYARHYVTNFHTFMPGRGNLGIPIVILDLSSAFRGAGRTVFMEHLAAKCLRLWRSSPALSSRQ